MLSGSILNGNVVCGNNKCTQRSSAAIRHLSFDLACPETTRRNECSFCKKERDSIKLVASNGNDPRFQEANCASAPAFFLFADHDMMYDENKLSAQYVASPANTGI